MIDTSYYSTKHWSYTSNSSIQGLVNGFIVTCRPTGIALTGLPHRHTMFVDKQRSQACRNCVEWRQKWRAVIGQNKNDITVSYYDISVFAYHYNSRAQNGKGLQKYIELNHAYHRDRENVGRQKSWGSIFSSATGRHGNGVSQPTPSHDWCWTKGHCAMTDRNIDLIITDYMSKIVHSNIHPQLSPQMCIESRFLTF